MADTVCPCGSGAAFTACCGPFLDGRQAPKTAEALMRSRYTAYVRENIAYLKETLWPKYQAGFDFAATARWASENHWTGLRVLETGKGSEADRDGTVLFEAKYLSGGTLHTHRENSRFRKKSGRWYYVEAI
ncbi:MAG: YchJ family protein [Labrenzia sp.]|uniref:YchJ family protein n=1 Tax=Labrenzia sp. R4_1 TaxID=2821106 RepID=UPI001ADA46D5|nr:YchJ family metal-binding protein [Labrenzia sp. R4_1]MBO9427488.1 SEC-C domain-containing protein [Labrenzia sp. R4_1]